MLTPDLRQSLGGVAWERLPLQLAGSPVLGVGGHPAAHLQSVRQVVAECLARPDDFPSIADAMVSGDQVTLIVDPALPSAAAVIGGAVDFFARHDAHSVTVQFWAGVSDVVVDAVRDRLVSVAIPTSIAIHDPTDREALRYVAADAAGDPVYLARSIVDAHLVVPLLAVRQNDADRWQHRAGIWPMLCDLATQVRSTEPNYVAGLSATETVGVYVAILVSPDQHGGAASIACGTPRHLGDLLASAESQNEHVDDETWPTAGLVIAMLEGPGQQTWDDLGRAIVAASRHVDANGVIVAWTDIQDDPPVDWQCALAEDSEVRSWASVVSDVMRDHRIYVRAGGSVESLGFAAIDDLAELRQLAGQFDSVGVLRSSPLHVAASV